MVTTFHPVRSWKTNYQIVNNLIGAIRRRRKIKDEPGKTYIPTANEFAGWIEVRELEINAAVLFNTDQVYVHGEIETEVLC